MKILFLTLSNSVENINNRGIYTDLLRYFHSQGHEIYTAFPYERRFKKNTSLEKSSRYYTLGIKTLNITQTNFIEKGIGTILLEYTFSKMIKKYWGNINFDLLLYSTPPTSFNKVIKSLKKRCGVKTYLLQKDFFLQGAVDLGVIKEHSLIYKFFKRQESELYKISDYIGCMSPANVSFILNKNPWLDKSKVEECPNSIEIDKTNVIHQNSSAIIKDKYGIPCNVPILIYGGNLGKPQGIDFLISVLNSNKNRTDCFFCIVGSGTEYGKLRSWYNSENISNMKLIPSLPKDEYDILMSIADIGLIFLDYRFTEPNFPSRLLSYLENKIPVLLATDKATDVGKIVEYNNIGYCAYSNDLSEYNIKLNKLLSEKSQWNKMGENGYKLLCSRYEVSSSYNIIMKHF